MNDWFLILRVLDSCQLTLKHKVATPADWKKGDDVIIVPALENEEAKKVFTDASINFTEIQKTILL